MSEIKMPSFADYARWPLRLIIMLRHEYHGEKFTLSAASARRDASEANSEAPKRRQRLIVKCGDLRRGLLR